MTKILGVDYSWIIGIGVGAMALYYLPKLLGFSKEEEEEEVIEIPNYKRLPVGNLTISELEKYTSTNESNRILVSVCGRIFDVSTARDFYGKEGVYECFTGADATYMLGALSLDIKDRNKIDFVQDGDHQINLSDWIIKYRYKYPYVGILNDYCDIAKESWREAGFDIIKSNENNIISFDEFNKFNDKVSVCGKIFDVKNALMVYDEIYGDFPNAIGNDISYAIAVNDFDKNNYNKELKNLNKIAKMRIKQYFKLFKETYPIIGTLKNEDKFSLKNLHNDNNNDDDNKENSDDNVNQSNLDANNNN